MDTTYFWELWIMAFKDYKNKKIINYKIDVNVKKCIRNNIFYQFWIFYD